MDLTTNNQLLVPASAGLGQNPFPQLIPNRVQAAIRRLHADIWIDRKSLLVKATAPRPRQCTLAQAKRLPLKTIKPGTAWGKLFDQRWCYVRLPQTADENTWLEWQDQGEATLYVNSQPHFGFNVAHRSCRLPKGTRAVWVQSSCIQSAIWHSEATGMGPGGSLWKGATIKTRDEQTWGAYHDLKCLFDLAMDLRKRESSPPTAGVSSIGWQPPMVNHSPVYRKLLYGMDRAVDSLEREGLTAMRRVLASLYKEMRMDKTFARCILTGHAHLDLVWIWPERMGELKAINIFATMDRLLEEYPEFRFAYSQPASYQAVECREPDLYARIQGHMNSGKWQATGAMHVESDTLLACGEALARSFLIGQAGFQQMTGSSSPLTWLPDVFGYSGCLPQIMKQTGVDYFFTTKMTWNAINRFPYSSFRWRGNDGSEVLAHVTQETGYVTHMTVDNIKTPMWANHQADVFEEYLLPTGYGDGGGGPTDEMLERARRLDGLPGMPSLQWDHPVAFFKRLSEVREKLPVWQGECYLEYHRGTYTTHSNLKAAFRNLERALQIAEAVSAITGKNWDREHTWRRLVFAQFHDYIPGSSVWDVYQEGVPELWQEANKQGTHIKNALQGKGVSCVFNPHAIRLARWIWPKSKDKPVYVSLPPLSGVGIREAIQPSPERVLVKGLSVSNGLTSFLLNKKGWIEELVWEGIDVPLQRPMGQLVLYPDRAANFEAWDIDRQVLGLGEICEERTKIEIVNEGPHKAGISVQRKVGQSSKATITYLLEAGSPLIAIHVDLDWQEPESLLKMHFPTKYAATHARFGGPFGSVLRPQTASGSQAEAMWEVPFSRYFAVFDDGEREGFFLVTESKYGATVRDGEAALSLVRSPRVTGMEGHGAAWPAHLARIKIDSPYSDMGRHEIRFYLGRYDCSLPRERQPATLADTLFTNPVFYRGVPYRSVLKKLEGGETLVPCWVLPDTNGFVLRLHEVGGQRGRIRLLLEDGCQVVQTDIGGQSERAVDEYLSYSPYEVVSLRFLPGPTVTRALGV